MPTANNWHDYISFYQEQTTPAIWCLMAAILLWHLPTTWASYSFLMLPSPSHSLLFSLSLFLPLSHSLSLSHSLFFLPLSIFQSNGWPHPSKYFVYLSPLLVFSATLRLFSYTRYTSLFLYAISHQPVYLAQSLLHFLYSFMRWNAFSKPLLYWYLLVMITALTPLSLKSLFSGPAQGLFQHILERMPGVALKKKLYIEILSLMTQMSSMLGK